MNPNLTSQYISYSMAVFSANEIRTFFFKFDLFRKISVVTQYNIAQHNIMHLGNKVYNFSLVFSQCFDEYFM